MNFLYILYFSFALVLGYTNFFGNDNYHFYLLTGSLLTHTLVEYYFLYKKDKEYFFLNPIFIGTFVTFLLAAGGITNFLQQEDGKFVLLEVHNKVLIDDLIWLKKSMMYVCIGSMTTWVGYKFSTGRNLFSIWAESLQFKRFLGSNIQIGKLFVLIIIAYAAKFYLYKIGLFGRITSEEFFEKGTGYKLGSQIRILSDLSYLTFVVVTYLKFAYKSTKNNILFYFSLLMEMFFAFLYGARSPILMIFVIIFLIYYYVFKKINLWFLALIPLVLVFAFTIVLEYKNYVLSEIYTRKENPIEQISDFLRFRKHFRNKEEKIVSDNFKFKLLGSFNSVASIGMAIRHKDTKGLHSDDPNFKMALVRFPLDAFVPRFIQGVNDEPWGLWFKDRVLNLHRGLLYSISINPTGFLYFAGDLPMILLGFFIYGVLLKFTRQLLSYGILGFINFLLVLSVLYNFDSVVSGTLTMFTRYIFIYPIIIVVLLKK